MDIDEYLDAAEFPRSLAGEEEEPEANDDLLVEAAEVGPLYQAVTSPEFQRLALLITTWRTDALDELCHAHGEKVPRLQEAISVYTELLELPDVLALQLRRIQEGLADDE